MQPIKVVISDNKMAAFVLLVPGFEANAQDIRDALRREGVTTGISPKALVEAAAGARGIIYQVAWGVPRAASSAKADDVTVEFAFAHSRGTPADVYSVDRTFKAAWRKLQARGAVRVGDVLACIKSPFGLAKVKAVTGEEISYADFNSRFKLGSNASFSSDGLRIVADRPGIPYVDERGAGVLDHVAVLGDIGNETGNLSFPGDLTVRGSILAGHSVSISGDLLVGGHIWGSATARGKIVVSGGITAPGGVIESGAGISCRFCENSVVRSRGPITIQEAALHSVVETEESVEVSGPKGRLIGGLTRAGESLTAATVGTPIGVPTVIELGISPKVRREAARLERDLSEVWENVARLRRAGDPLASGASQMDAVRMLRAKKHLEERQKDLSQDLGDLNDQMKKMPKGYFSANRVLPGTRVVLGTEVHEFTAGADRISMGVKKQ